MASILLNNAVEGAIESYEKMIHVTLVQLDTEIIFVVKNSRKQRKSSQFESLINPFIIMFSIPLAFTGSWVLLFLFKTPLSVMGLIGTLVLVGIVVNNGIVLIEYIDTLRHRDGYAAKDAVLKAAPTRLRPILMTALTTILGQIPLIISNGDNAEMLRGMGLVIAGGLATSTLLTLIVQSVGVPLT